MTPQQVFDEMAALEPEIASVTKERDALKDRLDDIHDAAMAAMDERCDMSERHCSCVPLLRAECKRLREALQVQCAERDVLQAAIVDFCRGSSWACGAWQDQPHVKPMFQIAATAQPTEKP